MGYAADLAANGIEAIEAVDRQRYDLVLMDVQMPEMDGLERTRAIVEQRAGTRPWIVAMTANAMDGDRERCLEAGMNGYIAKPIRVEELVAALLGTPTLGEQRCQVPSSTEAGPLGLWRRPTPRAVLDVALPRLRSARGSILATHPTACASERRS